MCSICSARHAPQLVPERGDAYPGRIHRFCPLCLDEMLSVFPLSPQLLARRQLLGRFPNRRDLPPVALPLPREGG